VRIDLNCDVGESFGIYTVGQDAEVMPFVTSANVACGFHAGDPTVMRRTVALARQHGVAVGAHPGLPDLVGFGRREMAISARDVGSTVVYQVGALAAVAASEGTRLQHVKVHGALYTMAARDAALASAVAGAVASVDRTLVLFGPPGSELIRAGERLGLAVAAEAFADRAYEPDGSLVSRVKPGSVLTDPETIVARVVRMATNGMVRASDDSDLRLDARTICIHGDTPGAPELARRVRAALEEAGVSVRPPGEGAAPTSGSPIGG
jgi:UPF0271 protein